MDYIGEFSALHGGADNILQVFIGDEINGNAGLGSEGLGHLYPNVRTIGGFDSGHLNGFGGHGGSAQAQGQNQRQSDAEQLFHYIVFLSYFCRIFSCVYSCSISFLLNKRHV